MRSLDDLQQEMRTAYLDGAPGMLVSALVWLAAGIVVTRAGLNAAVWTLFGHRTYWSCGALLIAAGYVCASLQLGPVTAAFAGAGIEAAVASFLLLRIDRAAA